MEITSQEKINIAYIFISVYENIVDLIKPIHNALCDASKNSVDIKDDFIISMYEKYKAKYNNKAIKIKNTHRLLVDANFMSNDELEILIKLSKIRNYIGHESLSIYHNESINYEFFMLADLLKLYKSLFNKFTAKLLIENSEKNQKLFNSHNSKFIYLSEMIKSILSDTKFETIKSLIT